MGASLHVLPSSTISAMRPINMHGQHVAQQPANSHTHPSSTRRRRITRSILERESSCCRPQASSLTRINVAIASAQATGPGTAVGRRELVASISRLVRHGKRLRGSSTPSWVLASWVLPTGRIRGHDDELLLLLLLLRPPQISPLLLPASSSCCCNNVKTDHDPNSTASEEHKSTKLHTRQTKSISLSEQFFFFLGCGEWIQLQEKIFKSQTPIFLLQI